jgi:hypothetical protein
MEQQIVHAITEVGAAVLAGLSHLTVPAYPAAQVACACGQEATYQRRRPAQVTTGLGAITLQRPYYLCAQCHHGHAPRDQPLGVCAGGLSAGLDELLALLGATEASFEAAVAVLQKLTLLERCPNSARQATARLGQLITAAEQQAVAPEQEPSLASAAPGAPPARL